MQTVSTSFRVRALSDSVINAARAAAVAGRSDHRYLHADGSDGFPCRSCLRLARKGERLILFPFRAIRDGIPYAESGPIYIHAEDCEQAVDAGAFPSEFRRKNLVLRAYNSESEIVDAVVIGDREPEEVIDELFARPEIAFLHARTVGYGCYMMAIERA